jgi:hypothetical protein
MDQIIVGLVDGVLVPVTDAIVVAVSSGLAFLVFGVVIAGLAGWNLLIFLPRVGWP